VVHPAELLDLSITRQDARAVCAQLPILDNRSELEREPEHLGEELEVLLVLKATGCVAGEAVQLAKCRGRKQVTVADYLVDDVRLRRV
jgi:hypothetical protein